MEGKRMVVIVLPLLVCILGLIIYLLAANAKAQELGRICFAFGLLVFLLRFGAAGVLLR
jgi:Na+/phosphate symporter